MFVLGPNQGWLNTYCRNVRCWRYYPHKN